MYPAAPPPPRSFYILSRKLTDKISPIWCNVKFNAVKTDTKLTLHDMGKILLFNLPR